MPPVQTGGEKKCAVPPSLSYSALSRLGRWALFSLSPAFPPSRLLSFSSSLLFSFLACSPLITPSPSPGCSPHSRPVFRVAPVALGSLSRSFACPPLRLAPLFPTPPHPPSAALSLSIRLAKGGLPSKGHKYLQKKRADTDVPKGKTSPPPALRRFGKRERRTETCALTRITGSSTGHWRLPTETRHLAFNNTARRGRRRMYTCRLYFGKEEREDFAGIPAVEPRKDEQAEACLCYALFPCARPVDIQPCKSEPRPPAAREWCPPSRRRPLFFKRRFYSGEFRRLRLPPFCGSPWRGRGVSKGEEEARQVSCIRVCGSTSSAGAVIQAIAELGVENRRRAFQYWGGGSERALYPEQLDSQMVPAGKEKLSAEERREMEGLLAAVAREQYPPLPRPLAQKESCLSAALFF